MPPADGASFLAALVANALRGALPPVDLLAVCLVRAMVVRWGNDGGCVHFPRSHVFFLFV